MICVSRRNICALVERWDGCMVGSIDPSLGLPLTGALWRSSLLPGGVASVRSLVGLHPSSPSASISFNSHALPFNIFLEALVNPPCSLEWREEAIAAACDEQCRMPNEQFLCEQPCGMWEAAGDGVVAHQACLHTCMFSSALGGG